MTSVDSTVFFSPCTQKIKFEKALRGFIAFAFSKNNFKKFYLSHFKNFIYNLGNGRED